MQVKQTSAEQKAATAVRVSKTREQFKQRASLKAKMRPTPYDPTKLREAVAGLRQATDRVDLDFRLQDAVWQLQMASAWKQSDVAEIAVLVAEAATAWSVMAVKFAAGRK